VPGTGRKFDVSLVTPDGAAFEGEAEMIIVPGQIGEIGVLARHAPLIATLKSGATRIHPGEGADVLQFATGPGFFQVLNDRAIALVDDAVEASQIDRQRAQEQLEAAQAELDAIDRGDSTADRWQIEQRLIHAQNQLAVVG
jgi:F-type H+-transporting ATPase subunit epsilon